MIQEPRFKKAHLELNNRTNEPLQLLVLKDVVSYYVVREEIMILDEDLKNPAKFGCLLILAAIGIFEDPAMAFSVLN
jgi:hypothetical protein